MLDQKMLHLNMPDDDRQILEFSAEEIESTLNRAEQLVETALNQEVEVQKITDKESDPDFRAARDGANEAYGEALREVLFLEGRSLGYSDRITHWSRLHDKHYWRIIKVRQMVEMIRGSVPGNLT